MAEAEQKSFTRFDKHEVALCLYANRVVHLLPVRHFFAFISRLGNGVFWYVMLASLPVVYGIEAVLPTLHIGAVALAGVVVYKLIKSRLIRERPFIALPDIICASPPLDRYSFPSGHALHAVSFSILILYFFPALGWIVLPFSIFVLLSRVILGLHYPSDVLAGAAIGSMLASSSLLFVG